MTHHKRQPIAILSNGISRHNFSPRASQAATNAQAAARVCMEEMRVEAVCPEWSVAQCCRRGA